MSSLRLPLDEPLSPELALVCPELAEKARRLLPEPGWVASTVKRETVARPSPLQTLVLGLICVVMTVTPLVLTMLALSSQSPPHRPPAATRSGPAQQTRP